jgi:acetoin utilization protein AcuB
MFTIHGVTGQIFSGTLEEMQRAHGLKKSKSVRAIAQEGDELGGVGIENRRKQEEVERAYRRMLPKNLERGPLYHANQIMQHQVITVSVDVDVAQAWRILRDCGIHQAPVLDSGMRLVGVVSERNLLTAINIDGDQIVDSMNRRVEHVMTTPIVAAAPVTDIRRIASVMLNQDIDGVPITNDQGLLVGFITRGDILRAVIKEPPLSLWQ